MCVGSRAVAGGSLQEWLSVRHLGLDHAQTGSGLISWLPTRCPRRCPSVNSRPASQPSQASPQQTQHRQDTSPSPPGIIPQYTPRSDAKTVGGGALGKRTWTASTVGYLAGLEHSLHRMSICGESSISFATRIFVHPRNARVRRLDDQGGDRVGPYAHLPTTRGPCLSYLSLVSC